MASGNFRATLLRQRMVELGAQRVEQIADAVAGEAVRLAPVDTGELYQSIRARRVNTYLWRVGAHAPHALYVELGTLTWAGKSYLRAGLANVLRGPTP